MNRIIASITLAVAAVAGIMALSTAKAEAATKVNTENWNRAKY